MILAPNYLLVYRIRQAEGIVEILRVLHARQPRPSRNPVSTRRYSPPARRATFPCTWSSCPHRSRASS
ncbi:type II toxin-antitoxin system RelE/ParE family toxin [Burkholderia sp. lig30]|uniref:type II toxin-antitoxin system RelE/ParE family toxin n=1 Tax=Burkholderia sp. lig30 TaxID=1192124 RepID=UPI002E0F6924